MPPVPPLQQPLGQVLRSQEQLPLVVSHRLFEQLVHALPPEPHVVGVSEEYGTQVLALQQPLPQPLPLQMHCPADPHTCPLAHAEHAIPPEPHEVGDWEVNGWHVPVDVQQPAGQEVASHWHAPVIRLHSWPAGQAEQVAPLLPH